MSSNEHTTTRAMAADATLHCLTGCAIGEITGLVLGTLFGLTNLATIIISVALAFIFGYALSILPLIGGGMAHGAAMTTVLAADSLSIAIMEIVDNTVVVLIPNAMGGGLVNPYFWAGLAAAMTAAFFAAWPVNAFLLKHGQGHALLHKHHETGK